MTERINPRLKLSPGGAVLGVALTGWLWTRSWSAHSKANGVVGHALARPVRDALLVSATIGITSATIDTIRGAT
jgi:hypothetical protein